MFPRLKVHHELWHHLLMSNIPRLTNALCGIGSLKVLYNIIFIQNTHRNERQVSLSLCLSLWLTYILYTNHKLILRHQVPGDQDEYARKCRTILDCLKAHDRKKIYAAKRQKCYSYVPIGNRFIFSFRSYSAWNYKHICD